jgi:WD40 repeat protein
LTMLFDSAGRGSATIAGPGSSGVGIAFHPSKRILAAPCDTNAEWAFCLWDVSDLAKPRRIDISQPPAGNGRTISALSFSADGNTLASADSSDEIKLWNVADPQKLHPINSHRTGSKEGVVDLAFHPDANVLAYACEDGSISYLDLDKMKIRDAAATHTSRVFQLAFSPNGKVLASAGEDRTVILWDYQKGEQLGEPLIGHVASVAGVAFKGDGTELASVDNGSLRVWNVSPGVKRICERAGRNLSGEEWKQYIGHDVTYRKTCEAQPANSDVEPVSFWKSLGAFIERQADKCDWCR